MEPVPERFKTYKNCKDIEPKGECTKNYVDKQKSGTKDLTVDTAVSRLKGRKADVDEEIRRQGG